MTTDLYIFCQIYGTSNKVDSGHFFSENSLARIFDRIKSHKIKKLFKYCSMFDKKCSTRKMHNI